MKKKAAAPKKPVKSVKKTVSRRSKSAQEPVLFQRIVIISACIIVALTAALFVNTHKPELNQSVAGLSITKGLYAQAAIGLPEIDGAVTFNIYFKEASENIYTNAVRSIPANSGTYTISHLKKGTDYEHRIVAVDAKGTEFWFSPSRPIVEIEPM